MRCAHFCFPPVQQEKFSIKRRVGERKEEKKRPRFSKEIPRVKKKGRNEAVLSFLLLTLARSKAKRRRVYLNQNG